MFKGKFFDLFAPVFRLIDSGDFFRKPFSWLFMLFAAVNILGPVYLLIRIIINIVEMIKYSSSFPVGPILSYLIMWAFIAFAGWVGFQLWLDRSTRAKDTSKSGDDYVATPAISLLIQTYGEWLGIVITCVGIGISLAAIIEPSMGIPFITRSPVVNIFVSPVLGYVSVIVFRFLAELTSALAVIANNTKK